MFFKFNKMAGNAVRKAGASLADAIKERFGKDDDVKDIAVKDIDIEEKDDGKLIIRGTARNQEEAEKAIIAAGNNEGVEEVESQIVIEEGPKPSTMYEVKSGDTLSKIAKAHYGDAMKYPVIFEANRPMLSDPDKIYPGQVLRIPPLS